ncbi:uncharacterized protein EDB93DRAFT_1115422 [Suillus bovinus]|uniref:uncharacterized protein n=1 Tax=Suillus bovinus TaxID=48563 RepID=UPI001B85D39E|nr:uncharacterized protein EDB93DRAFT_1115422 [Suillus bovinus]KAG2159388.1 hypothetical protein EDB93DRAFT_1115422 [Suillus bovinus]
MSSNQARINALLRKSLIGQLIDTQFYLFSVRSKRDSEGNATNLQALFADDEALTTGSEYFSNLLSENPSNDSSVVEYQDYHACEGGISLDEYGYASDSDLDEEEEETDETVQDNERCAEVSAEQVSRTESIKSLTTKRTPCIIPGRRLLVTDTAFNTWRALLDYLYTDEIVFAPLRSQASKSARRRSLGEAPSCSPKSMYRLACKIRHDKLQAKALSAIRSSLTEHNVLQELSSSLTSRFPAILEMEIEVLFENIVTPTIMKDFPTLIQRIASASLPHGADILTKLHERMLRQHYPRILSPQAAPTSENECSSHGSPPSGPFKFKWEEPQKPVTGRFRF